MRKLQENPSPQNRSGGNEEGVKNRGEQSAADGGGLQLHVRACAQVRVLLLLQQNSPECRLWRDQLRSVENARLLDQGLGEFVSLRNGRVARKLDQARTWNCNL